MGRIVLGAHAVILGALLLFGSGCGTSSSAAGPDAGDNGSAGDDGSAGEGGSAVGEASAGPLPMDAGGNPPSDDPCFVAPSPVDAGDPCTAPPPPAALVKMGALGTKGCLILPDGRALTPAGVHAVIGGFPADVRVHPRLDVAYVANTGYTDHFRSVQVVDTNTGAILQEIVRAESFWGLALSQDGTRLYASGGFSSLVDVYDVGADGKLSAAAQIPVASYPAGLALSSDGTRLWVAQFKGTSVVEVDTRTFAVNRTINVPIAPFSLLVVPETHELYVAGFSSDKVAVFDLNSLVPVTTVTVTVGGDPIGLAKAPNGKRVYVTVSNQDDVVAIDTTSHVVVASMPVGEASIAASDGTPLPASSPSGIAIDATGSTLYVARGADNAVDVLDLPGLTRRGSVPVGWYPTAVALGHGGTRLVVTNGKGVGTGPITNTTENGGKGAMRGSISLIDLPGLDVAALGKRVEKNVRRPDDVYPFACTDPTFPIPTAPTVKSPIEHIVLILKENKTYDNVLGDLPTGERDPSLVLWGQQVTPNLHALASTFTNHDNFYDASETSTQGHLWTTSDFVNDYIERTWLEDYRGHPGWSTDSVAPQARPSYLTFFTHLLDQHREFMIYGEIVGALDLYNGVPIAPQRSDPLYPGGPYFDLSTADADKAAYVGTQLVDNGRFPPFVYVLLPNDHTKGVSPTTLSPESMISDNDYAAGLLVDKISHSKYWANTAIFIVEDDPQSGGDHIDYHRSICVVASPWAKRGHTSSVHTSYPSLFRTFEQILGIPPMNRYDALATPLWDTFTSVPDYTPFAALPRQITDHNGASGMLAKLSSTMDFEGPDRNPDLGDLLWWYAKGTPRAGSRIATMSVHDLQQLRRYEGGDGDDDAFERDKLRMQAIMRAVGAPIPAAAAAPRGEDHD